MKTGQYDKFERNHVIVPGREGALDAFLHQGFGNLKNHKLGNSTSPRSEDALTWSLFDVLRNLSDTAMIDALNEIVEDSYEGKAGFRFSTTEQIEIHIGKTYTGIKTGEKTEVDASIETPSKLIFFEAKLYSPLSLADKSKGKPHDQIARKLRVGLDYNRKQKRKFYFVFLDIAPRDLLVRKEKIEIAQDPKPGNFKDKWKSAYWFSRYKLGGSGGSLSPLRDILEGVDNVEPLETIAKRMGWLTWSDLYKSVLRGLVSSTGFTAKNG
jgi:hypothetical protein